MLEYILLVFIIASDLRRKLTVVCNVSRTE